MRALTVTSFFLGTKGLRRWFASLSPGARACAHVLQVSFYCARWARPCSQVSFAARDARAHVLKSLFRRKGLRW